MFECSWKNSLAAVLVSSIGRQTIIERSVCYQPILLDGVPQCLHCKAGHQLRVTRAWTVVDLLGAGLGWLQFLEPFKNSSAILTPVLSCSLHFILGKLFHLNGFIWCRSSIWLYYPRDGSAGSPVKTALFDLDKSPFVSSLATDHHQCCHHCSRHWKRWFETTNKAIKPPFLKISEDSRKNCSKFKLNDSGNLIKAERC